MEIGIEAPAIDVPIVVGPPKPRVNPPSEPAPTEPVKVPEKEREKVGA